MKLRKISKLISTALSAAMIFSAMPVCVSAAADNPLDELTLQATTTPTATA